MLRRVPRVVLGLATLSGLTETWRVGAMLPAA